MPIEARLQELSWSHTRDQMLRDCQRKYFYRYHLAQGGWRRNAPETARRAYLLGQLTTFDLVLGASVHARAREIAWSILAEAPRPGPEALRELVRADLNRVYLNSRDPAAFRKDPRGHPMLLSAHYGRGTDPAVTERVQAKMDRCLEHLTRSAIWDEIAECAPGAVQVIDSPGQMGVGDTLAWVAPDLVYTPPGGRTVILDWKTGRTGGWETVDQLRVYGLYAHRTLKIPLPEDGYEGRIVGLEDGESWSVDLDECDLRAAEERVTSSAMVMRHLAGWGVPDVAAFPMTPRRGRCPECNYWELCQPEIRVKEEKETLIGHYTRRNESGCTEMSAFRENGHLPFTLCTSSLEAGGRP